MKIALITDTHFGVRNDHIAFLDNNKKFFENVFFPYLKNEKIQIVVHLGDLLDRRKYSNHYTIHRLREDFFKHVADQGLDFYWILGNHDLFYKHSLKVNTSSLVNDYPIKVIDQPCVYYPGSLPVLMIPWICDENRQECYNALEQFNVPICMGHFEFQGFDLSGKGTIQEHGYSTEPFKKFTKVLSGHYHHRSSIDNIHYLGATAEYTWIDYGDPRGFHILDGDNLRLDFIPNPYTMFQKVVYDDRKDQKSEIPLGSFEALAGKFIKVIVKSQKNTERFEWFMNKIEEQKPLQIQIIRDELITSLNEANIEIENRDTLSVIMSMIEGTQENVNHQKLKDLFSELFREAQE